ncbi:hypothetical protein TPAR_06086 [Tolypocladium paradoxum]|uniref:Uncharacterized protein n=1 Tax=Tolypocladium paradoxum TaxID=94208 RepID=A0A2S4KU29_9HYPO|nr:hypothetical protein TPAR_06086 [Tolypocladium paradoxum]
MILVKFALYVIARHCVPESPAFLLYLAHASMQASKASTVVRDMSVTLPRPSAASAPFGQSVKQYSVKLVRPSSTSSMPSLPRRRTSRRI